MKKAIVFFIGAIICNTFYAKEIEFEVGNEYLYTHSSYHNLLREYGYANSSVLLPFKSNSEGIRTKKIKFKVLSDSGSFYYIKGHNRAEQKYNRSYSSNRSNRWYTSSSFYPSISQKKYSKDIFNSECYFHFSLLKNGEVKNIIIDTQNIKVNPNLKIQLTSTLKDIFSIRQYNIGDTIGKTNVINTINNTKVIAKPIESEITIYNTGIKNSVHNKTRQGQLTYFLNKHNLISEEVKNLHVVNNYSARSNQKNTSTNKERKVFTKIKSEQQFYWVNTETQIIDSSFPKTNVTIGGKLNEPLNKSIAKIEWYNNSAFKDSKSIVESEIDANGNFTINLYLEKLTKIQLLLNDTINIYVLPGDNITVTENSYGLYTAKGIGEGHYNYMFLKHFKKRDFDSLTNSIKKHFTKTAEPSINSLSLMEYADSIIKVKDQFLEANSDNIAPEVYLAEYWDNRLNPAERYYLNIWNTIKNADYQHQFSSRYYRKSLYNYIDSIIHPDNQLMQYYNNYESLIIALTLYLETKINDVSGIPLKRYYDKIDLNAFLHLLYDRANVSFSGLAAYSAKYNIVIGASKYGFWDTFNSLYIRFTEEYPLSEHLNELNTIYKQFAIVKPGTKAYNFKLKDMDGKIHQLSDFKGKAVYIIIGNSVRMDKEIRRYGEELEKIATENNSTYINIYYGHSFNKINNYVETLEMEGLNLHATNKQAKILKEKFQLSSGYQRILIDVNGKIAYRNAPLPDVIVNDSIYFEKALNPPVSPEQQAKNIQTLKVLLISVGTLVIALLVIVVLIRRKNKRQQQLSTLNTQIKELELKAIRAQMNPHFMYNCLSSIQNLVQENENDKAHLYLSKFADLIRNTLKKSEKNEISLAEEIEMIEGYVSLEQLRFSFDFVIDKDENIDFYSTFIPPLLLQPLVENAIIHGLAHKEGDKLLQLKIMPNNNKLCIEIIDNGIGRQASAKISKATTGKGLHYSKERLRIISEKQREDYSLVVSDVFTEQSIVNGTKAVVCFSEEL